MEEAMPGSQVTGDHLTIAAFSSHLQPTCTASRCWAHDLRHALQQQPLLGVQVYCLGPPHAQGHLVKQVYVGKGDSELDGQQGAGAGAKGVLLLRQVPPT